MYYRNDRPWKCGCKADACNCTPDPTPHEPMTDHREAPAPTLGDEKYLLDEIVLRLERYRVSDAYGGYPDVVQYAREILGLFAERAEGSEARCEFCDRPATHLAAQGSHYPRCDVCDPPAERAEPDGALREMARDIIEHVEKMSDIELLSWPHAVAVDLARAVLLASAPQRAGTEGDAGERP